jgi:transcription antitermination factor NusG
LTSHSKNGNVTEVAKPSPKANNLPARWLAVYTRPRWEKKVDILLKEKSFESYCPLNKIRRKWSDRVKLVEEPLFKSYVFVKIREEDRTAIRMTPGVINFVYWDGKPAVIKEREITTIRKFLDEYENVEVEPIKLEVDERVRITGGPLMDHEGKVVGLRHKTVKVAIDSLGYILVAYIDRTKLTSARS